MKRLLLFCTAAFLLAACNNGKTDESAAKESAGATAASADTVKDEKWVPVDSATMMAKMMEYGTPGPMHAMMASWDGTWNGETTMWDYEGAAPGKSTSVAVNKMIMGGKYQSTKHSGSMMGMPFEGMSIMGFDNATKKFTSTWVDTWSTGIMNMSGTWDEATKSLSLTGKSPDICRPGKECTLREVFKVIDANTQHMEMYGPDPKTGKEFKMMEIKMTRKK
jgi:Protein of unknown function (DUF1579)